jgi:hypothetical protein
MHFALAMGETNVVYFHHQTTDLNTTVDVKANFTIQFGRNQQSD